MTTEFEGLKTNEFLRRRKLRLQQVREQSKDIAKKIRQRANVEKLRQVAEVDIKKEQEYFQRQEKLVKRLEQLYAKGVSSVGTGHKKAADLTQGSPEKTDVSRQRGREATAELRKKRQEQLDEQKKLLDRKLQAREAANEISREKTLNVANKILSKASTTTVNDRSKDKPTDAAVTVENEKEPVKHSDMATQWDFDVIPNEWEPNVPALSLPKDDSEEKEFVNINNNTESKSDKSKRVDLFALSAEMPSSLRGGMSNIPEERVPVKPSFTQVSEYLQSRGLRLRDTDKTSSKPNADLQSLKQTILRSRPSKTEGSTSNHVCHVLDDEVIPVPSWQAESNCHFCSHRISHHYGATEITVTNSQINKIFSSIRSNRELLPTPVLRGSSPFRRDKLPQRLAVKSKSSERSPRSMSTSSVKRNAVTVYNHSTRDSRNIPCGDERLVTHERSQEDAYSKAARESSVTDAKDRDHQQRLQEMRSKIAMTKQNVEKEYNDTLSFLNSMPKGKGSKAVKTAYMDERCEKMLKDNRQHKLQQEFRKIEKECRKHGPSATSLKKPEHYRRKSKSPDNSTCDDQFQYSWMPVPEGDGSLAIHTIPTTKPKTGNSVKFSKVDSYHEYRSRHKHTPPTKDRDLDKQKTMVESVLIQSDSESSDYSTDSSSVENLGLRANIPKSKSKKENDKELTDAERIIIYKVLDSKKTEKAKKKAKLISEIAKSLHSLNTQATVAANDKLNESKCSVDDCNEKRKEKSKESRISFEHIEEGIYKTSKEKGENITSLYFTDNAGDGRSITLSKDEMLRGRPCDCKALEKDPREIGPTTVEWETSDNIPKNSNVRYCKDCPVPPAPEPSAATSTASFKTAATDKDMPARSEGGFVKIIDDDGHASGKFYIGASGFLKDDDYEVIIQLRKKDSVKDDKKTDDTANDKLNTVEAAPVEELTPITSANNISDTKVNETCDIPSKTKEDLQTKTNVPSTVEISTGKSTEALPKDNPEIVISGSNINETGAAQEINSSDKGVYTDQLSHAIPALVTKSPFASPRPATSTYTQTTFNSSNHRPAYIHMSSSTSTAYMSPPEVLLPRFFRRDSDEDTNKAFNREFERFEKHDHCTCTKCLNKNEINNMEKHHIPSDEACRYLKSNIPIPPNTSRSYTTTTETRYCGGSNKLKNNCRKCRRCENYAYSVRKAHKQVSMGNATKKKPDLPKHTISSAAAVPSKRNTGSSKAKDNSNFNPLIKSYVNRLLTLNKEGLKAIEVVNQDCSSVATPGSSIIDVPRNTDGERLSAQPKLSLEQIKNELIRKVLTDYVNKTGIDVPLRGTEYETKHIHIKVHAPRLPKKRSIHKVKSLNISKHLLKNKNLRDANTSNKESKDYPGSRVPKPSDKLKSSVNKGNVRSKSSPTPRQAVTSDYKHKSCVSDVVSSSSSKRTSRNDLKPKHRPQSSKVGVSINKPFFIPQHRSSTAKLGSVCQNENNTLITEHQDTISTQTSRDINSDTNYVTLAENKLQNMEKIADLTEKCTQRLSNLAKVLDEVRKSKSLAYSQISTSDSASDVDQRCDKILTTGHCNSLQSDIAEQINIEMEPSTPALTSDSDEAETLDSSKYISFLTDIPKPLTKTMQSEKQIEGIDNNIQKLRTRPPPALSRLHLRHMHGNITPHELSTVVEVDSPMSVLPKNSSRTDKGDVDSNSNTNEEVVEVSPKDNVEYKNEEMIINPDLLQSNLSLDKNKIQRKKSTTDSSDESKLQMMDLKHFNEIMLQPFISIQEYAKQYDIGTMDEASNLDDVAKDDVVNEDLSSMQSDSSLPDVIAELLKRKIITEPFKFDTVSNVNSTTASSESSVLALAKVRKDKKKQTVMFQEKENVAESSDTLSFSSNPDLENAFKKLGMGWASSTLKKTKERLALSSSSNTSSSSGSQFKIKNFNNQDVPALVTDSVSTIIHLTKKEDRRDSKNNGQQTNMVKSMTVREFLTNELADKITFTNKSRRNDTEDEFVSLFETKMPEEMKNSSQIIDERSRDSGTGNRARTSTPVQIFKSMTYHSSSSSNMSNGLFSNADDLSSVKVTSNSIRNHSTSDKDDLTIPNCSLRIKRASDASKSD